MRSHPLYRDVQPEHLPSCLALFAIPPPLAPDFTQQFWPTILPSTPQNPTFGFLPRAHPDRFEYSYTTGIQRTLPRITTATQAVKAYQHVHALVPQRFAVEPGDRDDPHAFDIEDEEAEANGVRREPPSSAPLVYSDAAVFLPTIPHLST